MASLTELEAAFQAFLASKVEVVNLNDAERLVIFNKIFPEGAIIHATSSFVVAGSRVFGSGIPGINEGREFIGIATQANPTLDAHISLFIYEEI